MCWATYRIAYVSPKRHFKHSAENFADTNEPVDIKYREIRCRFKLKDHPKFHEAYSPNDGKIIQWNS